MQLHQHQRRDSVRRLLCGTALLALASGSAMAQQATGLEEIVVTATKTEEVLSRVPISVSAYTQRALDDRGVKSIDDLVRLTPGVTLARGGNAATSQTNISIRGINSGVGAGTTGIYIDDTPIQTRSVGYSSTNFYPVIFDLERVEVLRGPQGTLFGAGSEGGTVRFIQPSPSLRGVRGYARSELSFTQDGEPSYEVGAAIGAPIVEDKLGFRASAWFRRDGGFVDRVSHTTGTTLESNANWHRSSAARLAFTWAPTERLSITPSLTWQDVYVNSNDLLWRSDSFDQLGLPKGDRNRNGFVLTTPERDRMALPSLQVAYDFDSVKLISVSSFFYRKNSATTDYSSVVPSLLAGVPFVPGTPEFQAPVRNTNTQNNFTQELRLQSTDPDSRLSWVAGLFYAEARQGAQQFIETPTLDRATRILFGAPVEAVFGQGLLDGLYAKKSYDVTHDRQLAGFGEVKYAITDQLKAIVGLRVARTSFSFTTQQAGPVTGGAPSFASGSQRETPVTPKFGLTWQATDDQLYYATVSKGFRTGGANVPVPEAFCRSDLTAIGMTGAPANYSSDSVWSYEAGAKARFFDRRLQLDASGFYIRWNQIQQNVHLPRCGSDFVANLGEAESRGFDLQLRAQVTDDFILSLALGYTDAHLTKTIFGGVNPATGARAVLGADGDSLRGSPLTATVSAEYRFTAPGAHPAYLRADYEFHSRERSRNPIVSGYDPDIPTPGATSYLSARAGVDWDGWDVSIFANNVLNAETWLNVRHDVQGSPLFYGYSFRPRTVGLTLARRF